MELTIALIHDSKTSIYFQLYEHIKSEILKRHLKADTCLPSVRKLSKHLHISRNTVENAYHQLMAEGYIYSLPQKGYYISHLEYGRSLSRSQTAGISTLEKEKSFLYDFKNEYVEDDNFDFTVWRKHLNRILKEQQNLLLTYGQTQGELSLRESISTYIYQSRGVHSNSDHIVIGAGIQPLLTILCSLFKKTGLNSVALQDPGFYRAKNTFIQNGFDIEAVSDLSDRFDFSQLEKIRSRLVYLNPSHQFPTGNVMPIDSRTKIIHWINEQDGYIIEDDYNSELRYDGKPIPAMQGLDDSHKVIYLGSFSAVLIPAIRLSFMVLPEELLRLYRQNQTEFTQTASKMEQLTMAEMMKSGDFEKHIRKIRKKYAEKSEAIIRALRNHLGDKVTILGVNPGMNILLELKFMAEEDKIIEEMNRLGIGIGGFSEYRLQNVSKSFPVLVMSLRGIPTELIEKGILVMKQVFSQY